MKKMWRPIPSRCLGLSSSLVSQQTLPDSYSMVNSITVYLSGRLALFTLFIVPQSAQAPCMHQ